MLMPPEFGLFLYPVAGGVISVAGKLEFSFTERFGLIEAVDPQPGLYSDFFLWVNAEVKVVLLGAALVSAVPSAHFKVFVFGNFKIFFAHNTNPNVITDKIIPHFALSFKSEKNFEKALDKRVKMWYNE